MNNRGMRQNIFIILVMALSFSGCWNSGNNTKRQEASPEDSSKNHSFVFKLEKVADSLYAPLALENAHDGSGRIFVGEQAGRIMIIKNGKVLKQPFLDIRKSMVPIKNEYMDVGLLGFAFHPDFRHNGRFFVHYSAPSTKGFDNKSVLAEFRVSDTNPDIADNKKNILLEVEQPESNHNGGNIAFDEKGYLYIGFGDGGGQGDKHGVIGNGQDINQLLGKIIRLDVDHGRPYRIPDDNPFVHEKGRKEIWTYGMRMPWRISFDAKTHELFCGDVGQDKFEEIDIIEKGKNYGWRAMEGSHIYDSSLYRQESHYTLPVAEYEHAEGVSVIGGYVYRGKAFPRLDGIYIFGDWAFKLFYLEHANHQWIKHDLKLKGRETNKLNFRINSFGVDENDEIYVVTQNEVGAVSPTGVIYKIGLAE